MLQPQFTQATLSFEPAIIDSAFSSELSSEFGSEPRSEPKSETAPELSSEPSPELLKPEPLTPKALNADTLNQQEPQSASARQSQAYGRSVAEGRGVTELVLSKEQPDHLSMILPMIAHLSQQATERWITWIAPQSITKQQGINKALLQEYGVDMSKIRLVYADSSADRLWITWDALATGNSDTVIANIGRLNENEINQLGQAAHRGNCQGLLVRLR